jgi:antitoxin (DNA-binding transcriptional repressor) of toxin-antitoxin stability system
MAGMDKVSASAAKQSFGSLLERAASVPVGIERHGKLVAAMVPPDWLDRAPGGVSDLEERKRARAEQRRVEEIRLMAHQRIGIDLLVKPQRRDYLLGIARQEVQRWADHDLCSRDYIERWGQWLSLPEPELVQKMCSDADGWGTAMRQNSPFAVAD